MTTQSVQTGTAQATEKNFTRIDIHQSVTDTIIKQLEAGTVPWIRPYKSDVPMLKIPLNFVTGQKYQSTNIIMLWSAALEKNFISHEWASLKQWNTKKEYIRKGENGTMILYYETLEKEVDGEIQKIPMPKYSKVFNRCQLQSWQGPEKYEPYISPEVGRSVAQIDRIEQFVHNTNAIIGHEIIGPYYDVESDVIVMPPMDRFEDTEVCTQTEGYVSTLFHELTHLTGAKHRLNRPLSNKFGTKEYAQEELTAELGAAFLCAEFDIATAPKGNHAAYIASWLKVLKENKHCLTTAAKEASRAVNYLTQYMP